MALHEVGISAPTENQSPSLDGSNAPTPSIPLRIWLIQTGEEMPFDPGPPRLVRTALLGRELVRRGHEVTFWNATFNHQRKMQRAGSTVKMHLEPRYQAILLKGCAYGRNISLTRIVSQRQNAQAFRKASEAEATPDVILCGMPPIEIADAAANYAERHQVPMAIDCRDLWPDVIRDYLSRPRRMLAAPILAHWERMLGHALARATAIVGVSEGFVNWAVSAAGRARGPLDRSFHLTLSRDVVDPTALQRAEQYWSTYLPPPEAEMAIGVYAGSMSRRFDLATVSKAVMALPEDQKGRIRIVVCGKGDVESHILELSKGEPSLVVPGWRNAAELQVLMKRAQFGILPYPSSRDFLMTFPNKVGEYLAFGLPIMTGLGGVVSDCLGSRGVTLPYETGNVDSATRLLSAIAQGEIDMGPRRIAAVQAFSEMFDSQHIIPAFADYLEDLALRRTPEVSDTTA